MIAPVLSYTIKGVIWYQGEGNAGRAAQYRRLFPAMIANWRNDFDNKKMPFYFVQISPHRSQNPEIRDAQLFTLLTVPHTGMVVTTDNGDSLDIHPRNKKLVGERLSLWALKNDYGKKELVASGPLYKSMKTEGNKIRISFDDAGGLQSKDGDLKEFTIAGEDANFVDAKATIEGNTIVVWSDAVPKPVAVRFAWKNVPSPNLYNNADLPASPFRTDNWKVPTEGKKLMRKISITAFCLLLVLVQSANAQVGSDMSWVRKAGAAKLPAGQKIFNTVDYGVVNDTSTVNTSFIQKAIDDCAKKGGGIVTFKPGTYVNWFVVYKNECAIAHR